MLLVLDVLATAEPDLASSPEAGHQPRPVRVVAVQYGMDMKRLNAIDHIIRPDGWKVPQDCGITQKEADRYGVPIRVPLPHLRAMTDVSVVVVAHGLERVDAVIQIWRSYCKGTPEWIRPRQMRVCTAALSAPLCKLPTPGSMFADHYRMPSLSEATELLCGEAKTGIDGIMSLYTYLKSRRMLEAAA